MAHPSLDESPMGLSLPTERMLTTRLPSVPKTMGLIYPTNIIQTD